MLNRLKIKVRDVLRGYSDQDIENVKYKLYSIPQQLLKPGSIVKLSKGEWTAIRKRAVSVTLGDFSAMITSSSVWLTKREEC